MVELRRPSPPVAGFAAAIVVASSEYAHANEEGERCSSSFGVLCHEFGHLLGLPELYAPGGAMNEGIGKWGLMGQGTWVGQRQLAAASGGVVEAPARVGRRDDDHETTRAVRLPAVTDEPLV